MAQIMPPLYVILFGILINSLAVSAAVSTCLDGWSRFKDSCYHTSHDQGSWAEAMKLCEEHRGKLATVENAEEQGYIANLLKQFRHANDFWIAGSDWSVLGRFVWEPQNVRMNYTNWHRGEPDSSNHREQACVAIRHGYNYQWSADDCQNRYNYICEMK